MRYSLNPEFDTKLREAFEEMGLEEAQEALLELMDPAAIAFSDKVCLRIARCLVDEDLSPEKIKRITGCDIREFSSTLH
jgi:uridylate kinase